MSIPQPSPRSPFAKWSLVACIPLYSAAFVATHLPPSRVPSGVWHNDKLAHIAGFFVLGVATAIAFRITRRRAHKLSIEFALWPAMMAYAFFDEITQPLVGRSFEWGDLAADGVGAMFGISVVHVISRIGKQ